MIVLMAGLPGSGKTTLALELARRTGGIVLNKDEIRSALFPPEEIEYSTAQDNFCQGIMLQTAEYVLQRKPERIVVLDGRPFARRYQIEQVIERATVLHQKWVILDCACSEQTARERLQQQACSGNHPAANRDFNLYRRVKATFEPIVRTKTVIDTEQPLELCVQRALAAIRTTEPQA